MTQSYTIETFQGYVEAIEPHQIQVRTRSSEGEEATAWMEIAEIPAEERSFVYLGAEFTVDVFEHGWTIRFKRADQPTPEGVSSGMDLTINDFTLGKRVEMHPGTDRWMMGDRYGTITQIDETKGLLKVKLDRSERVLTVTPRDINPISFHQLYTPSTDPPKVDSSKCVWCEGTGWLPISKLACRACHGTGVIGHG